MDEICSLTQSEGGALIICQENKCSNIAQYKHTVLNSGEWYRCDEHQLSNAIQTKQCNTKYWTRIIREQCQRMMSGGRHYRGKPIT